MVNLDNVVNLIKVIQEKNNEPITGVQKDIVVINANVNPEVSNFDISAFCLERGIDITSYLEVSRLLQFGKEKLMEFWDYCSLNKPDALLGLTTPSELYSRVNSYYKAKSYVDGEPSLGGRN